MNKTDVLTNLKCCELGIAPTGARITGHDGHDTDRMLNLLDEDSRRAAKRKFRKLWRKELHQRVRELEAKNSPIDSIDRVRNRFGAGLKDHTLSQRRCRRKAVRSRIIEIIHEELRDNNAP